MVTYLVFVGRILIVHGRCEQRMTMEGIGGVVASSLRAWGGMVNMLALMVEGGCDTSYFSIGDGWVIPRRG